MKQIVNRTKDIAYDYLGAFGFESDKIDATVSKGLTELESAFERLGDLADESFDFDTIDNALHTLKGILFQLGNGEDGHLVDSLRGEITASNHKEKILELLHPNPEIEIPNLKKS
jgi:hypothetical protein